MIKLSYFVGKKLHRGIPLVSSRNIFSSSFIHEKAILGFQNRKYFSTDLEQENNGIQEEPLKDEDVQREVNVFKSLSEEEKRKYFQELVKNNSDWKSLLEKQPIYSRAYGLGKRATIGTFNLTTKKFPAFCLRVSDNLSCKAVEFTNDPTLVLLWTKNFGKGVFAEITHYYNGFKLFFFDIRQSISITKKAVTGHTISRRERTQLVKTFADIFKIFPIAILIALPVLDVLIPVMIKYVPQAVPSSFVDSTESEVKTANRIAAKMELAKFLKETMLLMADTQAKIEGQEEIKQIYEKIMHLGTEEEEHLSNKELIDFCNLFKDEITINKLSHYQLVAVCKFLDISIIGSDGFLRYQIRNKLRKIKADDMQIHWEGIDTLSDTELIFACKERGLKVGKERKVLIKQLESWIDLSIQHDIPSSLLIVSRIFSYLNPKQKEITTEKLEKGTILIDNVPLIDEEKENDINSVITIEDDIVDNIEEIEALNNLKDTIASLPDNLVDAIIGDEEDEGSKNNFEEKLEELKTEKEIIELEQIERSKDEELQDKWKTIKALLLAQAHLQTDGKEEFIETEQEELEKLVSEFLLINNKIQESSSLDTKTKDAEISLPMDKVNKKMTKYLQSICEDMEKIQQEPLTNDNFDDQFIEMGKKEEKISISDFQSLLESCISSLGIEDGEFVDELMESVFAISEKNENNEIGDDVLIKDVITQIRDYIDSLKEKSEFAKEEETQEEPKEEEIEEMEEMEDIEIEDKYEECGI